MEKQAMSDPGKRIIVDEDWKQSAQEEKEKLEVELQQAKGTEKPAFPTASFEVLINSLAMPAMMNLGMVDIPDHKPQLEEAQFYIDLLTVVEQKTKGNLEVAEHNLLTSLLYELRMLYVKAKARG